MRICTLASSSSGNSTLISDGRTNVLIDAGISMRRIKKSLAELDVEAGNLNGIFITHEHTDHIAGIKMISKYYRIPIYAPPAVARLLDKSIPEAHGCINIQEIGNIISLEGIEVRSFRTMHDTTESVGYRISGESGTMAFATDLGCVTDEVRSGVLNAQAVVIEANHDIDMLKNGPYPYYLKKRILSSHGHLSNDDSGGFAAEIAESGARKITLAHLSRENNMPRLARDTVANALKKTGADLGGDVELSVAPADTMHIMYI